MYITDDRGQAPNWDRRRTSGIQVRQSFIDHPLCGVTEWLAMALELSKRRTPWQKRGAVGPRPLSGVQLNRCL